VPPPAGAQVDQSVLEQLIRERLPELAACVADLSTLSSASLSWFLTLFLSVLPFLSAVRVVDCFFLHGVKAVFQLALAALHANTAALAASTDDGQALMTLSRFMFILCLLYLYMCIYLYMFIYLYIRAVKR